jgi:hypothetical protein
MTASIAIHGGRPAARGRGRRPARRLGTPREATNGAPCLGLALAGGVLLWSALGSALALLLA